MVGQVGLEPTTALSTEFMVFETRIELEIYKSKSLDYYLLEPFVK